MNLGKNTSIQQLSCFENLWNIYDKSMENQCHFIKFYIDINSTWENSIILVFLLYYIINRIEMWAAAMFFRDTLFVLLFHEKL